MVSSYGTLMLGQPNEAVDLRRQNDSLSVASPATCVALGPPVVTKLFEGRQLLALVIRVIEMCWRYQHARVNCER
jgi:hypothetical protein